jgi:hypothetical protein
MGRASSPIGSSVRSRLSLLPVLLAAALLAGCGARYARVPVHQDDTATVVLRSELRSGEPFERSFAHPVTIAGVRLAHVLAQIDVRTGSGGELLSRALAQANSTQEVVVQAVRRERRLGLFTTTYATSFVAWVGADERLHLQLFRIDQEVPKGSEEELREPLPGREVMAFRVLASESIEPTGHQSVAVHWRDERFRNPTMVRVGPGGKISRRTVLMEDAAPAAPADEDGAVLPTDPDALRALADLEDARRAGRISEAEYQRQRAALVQSQSR